MQEKTKDQLLAIARDFDEKARSIIPSVKIENYGEWLSEYTENFFKEVGKIIGIDYNSFADTIFDDHPQINNTPVMICSNGKLIWNNVFGFENYGLKRTLENIENYMFIKQYQKEA